MFHRKRHHHHQRSSNPAAVSSSSRPADLQVNGPAASSALSDYTGQQASFLQQQELAPPALPPRRSTSPVCPRAVELATAAATEGATFRLPDHSPSPVRRQVGGFPVRSQAASPESGGSGGAGMTSSPSSSSLTGLFRRKRSPMELVTSQSFSYKSASSPSKPAVPPKPHRLVASSSTDEPKGRSPSPLPSGNMLTAMIMGTIHSAGLDMSQGQGEQQQQEQGTDQKRANNLPTLVLNAAAGQSARSEPVSPSLLHDPRQIAHCLFFFCSLFFVVVLFLSTVAPRRYRWHCLGRIVLTPVRVLFFFSPFAKNDDGTRFGAGLIAPARTEPISHLFLSFFPLSKMVAFSGLFIAVHSDFPLSLSLFLSYYLRIFFSRFIQRFLSAFFYPTHNHLSSFLSLALSSVSASTVCVLTDTDSEPVYHPLACT